MFVTAVAACTEVTGVPLATASETAGAVVGSSTMVTGAREGPASEAGIISVVM